MLLEREMSNNSRDQLNLAQLMGKATDFSLPDHVRKAAAQEAERTVMRGGGAKSSSSRSNSGGSNNHNSGILDISNMGRELREQ